MIEINIIIIGKKKNFRRDCLRYDYRRYLSKRIQRSQASNLS